MRKIIGKKNKVHYVEETTRFQMVKSHKGWLVIGASMFALGLGGLVTSQPVSADVVATSTSSSAVNAETTSASSSSAVNAETTSAISSSSAVKTETTSASGASDAKSVVQPMADNTAVLTNVTKDNFKDYFSLNGSATYNQTTGIVTITPDENDKVGNFSLKSKIDMNSSFTLTGQVNIGNKTSSQGGADGIGFAFHNGNTTDVGNSGGNLGIAGLQDAIGFKLDTYHNGYKTPQANEDGAQVASIDSDGYGTDTDPDGTQFPQFGAFVNTSQKLVQAQDGNSYSRWWATTDINSVQKLNSGDLDGQFHNFVVSYDGSNRNLTIKYTETGGNVLTWSTSIPSEYQAMAMFVSASTGGNKNLQQFKISSFDFKQAATVNVKYVDQKGNRLAQGTVSYPSGANVNGTYTTGQLEIPNYKFVRMDDGTATGSNSLPATGTLTKAEDNGTVIYVYAPAYTQTSKTISETIKYIDQDGKEVAKGYTADPITFVTVTNPVDNTTTTYYSTKAKTATLDDNGVPTEAGWTKADSTDFAEVVNPEVDGYKVISNDAPNSDLTNVAVQTVYTNSSDLDFTVVYAKNAPTITTESKTINETIHYVYKDGTTAHDDYVAKPVEFTREVSTDAVTGEKTYGSWSADQSFAAVTSPAIKGYTPDQAEIDKQIVNGDSKDLEFKVTYTKTPVAGGNVTAKYVDENGNPIADDVIASGNVGDPYSTTQKDVPGYTFKEIQGPASGQFTSQEQTVTYVYTKDPVAGGNVTAKYVDENGNPIADDVIASGNVGDPYSTTQKDVPGYTFKEIQGPASGQFTSQEQTVTYVYTKDPVAGGNVTAKYVDENGNPIADDVIASGNVGDPYSTTQKDVPGYTFKEIQGPASGQFTSQEQTVTYVYTKDPVAGGNVTAKYVDENGNPIADDVIASGNVGDPYSTTQKDVPGYTFKEIQGPASGQFTSQEQTVTYVYTKDPVAGGNVTAKYVDENGNPIADDVIASGNVGDPYSTTQKDVPGYTFKEIQGPASGQFTSQEQTVTYVYTKDPVVGGNVIAKYVDAAGNTISDNVVKSGNVGEDYTTEQKTIPGYSFKEIQGPASGQFTSQEQTVTYVYTKDPVVGGSVIAKYVDAAGNTISDNVVKSGNVGEDYTTEQKTIPGYSFKEIQGPAFGQFTSQEQTVTYVYTKDPVAGGNVTAKYVDENGNPIADDVIASGNVGDPYSTTQKDVPGYTFKEIQGPASGQFTSQEQTVTYVYTKDPVAGGNVTAKYVDENGNPIADDVIASGNVGDPYSTTQKDVPGYTFKEIQGPASGQFTSQEQTVTYVYTKDPVAGGNVTAKYVDENGNPIADDVIASGNVGDPYSTTQKDVPGYTFKEIQGPASGQFTSQEQTVTYVYTKDPVAGGNVTAKYVDENGNPIADDVIASGNVGDPYSTTQKDVPGYTFKEIQGPASGQFTSQEQTVTYVYTKDPVAGGNVTAKYVDENGNPIADDVIASGNVGDPYSTTQKDVPGYTFKEIQGPASGQFTSQEQTVTYVYTKDPVAGGNVTAKYVDENGNPIADDVIASGNVGDPYSTTQKDVPGYTFKEIQGPASGQFTSQEQTVTYVYTKDPVVGGNVIAKYVDAAGNTISDNVVKSGNVGEDYTTEQKTIPGYSFKEIQGPASGQFTSQEQTVTYVYTKDPVVGGNVIAKYVDAAGNTISDNVVKSGNVGEDYTTEQKTIPGYTFKEVQGNPTGSFTDQDQTVTYVYTKNPATDNNGGTGPNRPGKPGNGTDTGNSSSNQPGNTSQPSNAANNGVINTSTNTGSKVNNSAVNSPELPQTGENNSQSQTMSFIGILLAMFGSLLGFLGVKKRRNN